MRRINVARDFTRFPSGRFRRNGATSGEAFRQDYLEGPIGSGEDVVVELDDTIGYGSSFLEEAFGGLVRSLRFDAKRILDHLQFDTKDEGLREEITTYIKQAAEQLNRGS